MISKVDFNGSVTNPLFALDEANILNELNTSGFVCLENFISPFWLEEARNDVHRQLKERGYKYFSLVWPSRIKNSAAQQIVNERLIRDLFESLVRQACPNGLIKEDIYNVLRIVAGPKCDEGSLQFHFDASVLTALVPIFMPENTRGQSGELILFPNVRPFRKYVIANIIDKLLKQNSWYRKKFTKKHYSDPDACMRVLKPGDMYLFWGYRTYHGNLACSPNSLRATMLLHFGNPHGGSKMLKLIRSLRMARESIRRGGDGQ
jgi:hypothetical protein